MDNQLITFTSTTEIPEVEVAARFGLALLLGAIIGLDREARNKAAGLRTHMLVALAATMFTVVTFELFARFAQEGDNANLDAIRIIEAVTAGVAFLAAGAIIQSRGAVRGLTTGASMWMAGAIGVACGSGLFVIAIIGTVVAVVVLTVIGRLQYWWSRTHNGEPAKRSGEPDADGSGRTES